MKPGTNRIVWGLCSLALCGLTIVLANGLYGPEPLHGPGNKAPFWLFLGASAVLGSVGAFQLFIGARERRQFVRTTASISGRPGHAPTSPAELILRISATLAATDGDLTDRKRSALRKILAQVSERPVEAADVAALLTGAVSSDIASEVLSARDWLEADAKDFILRSCHLLVAAMDDPGPVQEELLVRIAAAMGMSELDLSEHFDRLNDAAVRLPRFDATDRNA